MELWDWLASNPGKDKIDWPGWRECEYEILDRLGCTISVIDMCNDCPCCQYNIETYDNFNCSKCLLNSVWSKFSREHGNYCEHESSPYALWVKALESELTSPASFNAMKISIGAWKELYKVILLEEELMPEVLASKVFKNGLAQKDVVAVLKIQSKDIFTKAQIAGIARISHAKVTEILRLHEAGEIPESWLPLAESK